MNVEKIYNVTDIGANTVKCTVYAVSHGKADEIAKHTEKLGLIARVRGRRLPPDDITLLCDTLAGLKSFGERYGAARFMPFATASLRAVDNFEEISEVVRQACGEPVTLLSPEDEARISFAGFKARNPGAEKGIMADLGGGSTELVEFDADGMIRSCSMDFGCLSLFRRFSKGDIPTAEEEQNIFRFVTETVRAHGYSGTGGEMCIVGGTGHAIRDLAREFGMEDLAGKPDLLYAVRARLAARDPADVDLIEKLIPTRRETIIPGLTAYCALASETGASGLRISEGGLRDGIIALIVRNEL